MYQPNVDILLKKLKDTDKVLDIGGWACPFNRANYVLDAEAYETRGNYVSFGGAASQGGDKEFFTKDTWITRDICEHTPYPFPDKFFDFVICSHVLEDIRDPLWVCSEMIRVSKSGYIEIPSRLYESCEGVERMGMTGWSHHRWLIDTSPDSIVFHQKFSMIHSEKRCHLPNSFRKTVPDDKRVQWLWWNDSFNYKEVFHHGIGHMENFLAEFVSRHHQYSPTLLKWEAFKQRVIRRINR